VIVEGYQYEPYGRQTVILPGGNGIVEFGADDLFLFLFTVPVTCVVLSS
jgi:hypothetical protein